MLLSLDTSHGASVALLDDFTVLGVAASDNPRRHTESLTPLISEVLTGANVKIGDLTGIAVGTGPAPFTGLRVGLVTARTLAFARGIPAYGVSALAGVARGVFDAENLGEVTVVTDARRKEVYWARYAPSGEHDVSEISAPAVARPEELAQALDGGPIRGHGVELYPEHFDGSAARLDAATLGRIALSRVRKAEAEGLAVDLPTEPLYLRRPDIHSGAGRKRAS